MADSGRPDAAVRDAGPHDIDGGAADGGPVDAGADDSGFVDPSTWDGGVYDAGNGADSGVWPRMCLDCHGSDGNPAPPRDTQERWDHRLRSVGAHRDHGRPSILYRPAECSQCHPVPASVTEPQHLNGAPDIAWGSVANARSVRSTWDGTSCVTYCHGVSLRGGDVTRPEWATILVQQTYCGSCHGVPPTGHPPDARQGCSGCHPFDGYLPLDPRRHVDGVLDVTAGCGACHGVPPATAGHATHATAAPPVYGGLATTADVADPSAYSFGCGHCHPTDTSRHMDGTVQVDLSDPGAPPGSLKARNPSTASYTPGPTRFTDAFGLGYTAGTCRNIACHSGNTTEAPSVPEPGVDFEWDGGYPVFYPPYAVNRPLFYRPAVWGGTLSCAGCHDYPPRSDTPEAVDGGVGAVGGAGSSHASIGPDGYESLHAFNHGPQNDPVPCRACHFATVNVKAAWQRDPATDHTTFDDIPIADLKVHVNGQTDVRINNDEVISMFGTPMPLTNMTWNPGAMTCTNAPCHLKQTEVKWGLPYRWPNTPECNICHDF